MTNITEACPDCRKRNGCKLDCNQVCAKCAASIEATVRRAYCNGTAKQEALDL